MGPLNNNTKSAVETQITRTSEVNSEILGEGRTESDATHIRLRGEQEDNQFVTCLSCHTKFKVHNISDLYQHYTDVEHRVSFADCLYCKGRVHQYYSGSGAPEKANVKTFHDCLRWRRGDFK